ncbi:hypothetical protein KDM41_02380 [bacterium]|nr:hypothetical protein [bacterium]
MSVRPVALGALLALAAALAPPARAETIVHGPGRYELTTGTTFNVDNDSSTGYLFGWNDGGSLFAGVRNPTLILHAGRTYVFRRVSAKHPLIMAGATLPVAGAGDVWTRATADTTVIAAARLRPLADFTADPAPTTDAIVWTPLPADAGLYWYTCDVPAHVTMTGRLEVVADGVAVTHRSWGAVKALYREAAGRR